MIEIWKDIEGYENYQISTFGNVHSKLSNKELKKWLRTGYPCVDLQGKYLRVHRIVALNFLENPENKEQVDHKDGDKLNNNILNLRWATGSENCANKKKYTGEVSTYKGITFVKERKEKMLGVANSMQRY